MVQLVEAILICNFFLYWCYIKFKISFLYELIFSPQQVDEFYCTMNSMTILFVKLANECFRLQLHVLVLPDANSN